MLFLFAALVCIIHAQVPCIGYTSSMTYDLTTLIGTTVSAQDGGGFWSYDSSICGSTVPCGSGVTTGYCQVSADTQNLIGAFSGVDGGLADGSDGARLQYTGGTGGRFGYLAIKCNKEATGKPLNVQAFAPKETTDPYFMTMEHASACGKPGGKSKISPGSVILILFFVLIVVYLAAGIAYNALKNGERGLQMIPQYEFWSQFPFLIVDGFKFILHKLQALRGGGSEY